MIPRPSPTAPPVGAGEAAGFFSAPILCSAAGCSIAFAGLLGEIDRAGRPGARCGAGQLRQYLAACGSQGSNSRLAGLRAGDLGDLATSQTPHHARRQIHDLCRSILTAGAIPFLIGGDDETALPQVLACAEALGPSAAIHFGGTLSGALNQAAAAGALAAAVELGARSGFSAGSPAAGAPRRACFSAAVLEPSQWLRTGQAIRAAVRRRPAILLFDVNFLDPAYAPAAAKPLSGGFSPAETEDMLDAWLPGLNIRAVAAYGLTGCSDPCGLSCPSTAAVLRAICTLLSRQMAGGQA